MNEMMAKIIYAIIEMFCMFGVGALAMRLKLIAKDDLDKLGRLVLDIMFPMLIFSSITLNFDHDKLQELWLLPLLGYGVMFFGALIGFVLRYGMRNREHSRIITFHYFCAISNYVFLPLIILQSLWGMKYVAMLLIMHIGYTLGVWTIGIALLSGKLNKEAFKNIFSINLLAAVLAIAFSLLKIPVPTLVNNVFSKIGESSITLMLMLIGAGIYSSAHHLFKNKFDIVYLTLVRLVILPLLVLGILKLLPLSQEAFRLVFIGAMMPVSAGSVVVTRRFGGNPDLAAQATVITTLVSIITVPLMAYFFLIE